MATASIRSLLDVGDPVDNASREDLSVGNVVTLAALDDSADTYLWTMMAVPVDADGTSSSATLDPLDEQTTAFTVDLPGAYLVRLTVDNGEPGSDTQVLRFRCATGFSNLRLVAAGERRDDVAVIPTDAGATGWADTQNTNILKVSDLVQRVSPSGNVVYVDPDNGQYASLQLAVDYAEGEWGTDNEYVLAIQPGVYADDVTITGKAILYPVGGPGTVTIRGSVYAEGDSLLKADGIRFVVDDPLAYAIECTGNASLHLDGCTVLQESEVAGSVGALNMQTTGSLTANRCEFISRCPALVPGLPITPPMPAVYFQSTSPATVSNCHLEGPIGIMFGGSVARGKVSGCGFTPTIPSFTGSLALVTEGSPDGLELSGCTFDGGFGSAGAVSFNLGQEGTGNATAAIRYSNVANVLVDTTSLNSLTLERDASKVGTITDSTLGVSTLVLAAGTEAKTIAYDPDATSLAASTVQEAIDELANSSPVIDPYQFGLVKTVVEDGDTLTIPDGFQYIVYGALQVDGGGTVDGDGDLIVLNDDPGPNIVVTSGLETQTLRVIVPQLNTAYIVTGNVVSAEDDGRIIRWNVSLLGRNHLGTLEADIDVSNVRLLSDGGGLGTREITLQISGGQFRIRVTGEAVTTIRWAGEFEVTQVAMPIPP